MTGLAASAVAASPVAPAVIVVAVDPGPTPGVVVLAPGTGVAPSVMQCDAGAVLWLVRAALDRPVTRRRILAVERFVVRGRSARSARPAAGEVTRDMIGALTALAAEPHPGAVLVSRSASEVMPWATDTRLRAAGLYDVTAGMPHARAAARHALFASVADGAAIDPLSRRAAP